MKPRDIQVGKRYWVKLDGGFVLGKVLEHLPSEDDEYLCQHATGIKFFCHWQKFIGCAEREMQDQDAS